MMLEKFDEICMEGKCGDVKQFHFDQDLVDYLGGEELVENYDVGFTEDGVDWLAHWLFFNVKHESSVFGVLYMSTATHEVRFGVVGSKLEMKNGGLLHSFDEVYSILTDSQYFVD